MKSVQITTMDDSMSVSCKGMQLSESVPMVSMHIHLLKIASSLWPTHYSRPFTMFLDLGMAGEITLHNMLVQVSMGAPCSSSFVWRSRAL